MKTELTRQDVRWIVGGAAIFVSLFAALWLFRQDPSQKLTSKATRVDLVQRMEAALSSASEAEKSAVLAVTDADSQTFADQARSATAEVERVRQELGTLLAAEGTQGERELLAQFSEVFAHLQKVDDELLRLAVKNTNVKAYALAFGPAAEAVEELDAALARVVERKGAGPDGRRVILLALGARAAVLRIQTLLPPHIAEESSEKMDRLEARMLKEELEARKGLADLAAMPGFAGDADLAAAAASFARYAELKAQVLALSRENTNVQSLALSLNQKRKAMVECLAALGSLKQAILDEPIPGVSYGRLPTR
jgi:hypothetical protein